MSIEGAPLSFELAQKHLGLKTILSIHAQANDWVLSHNKFSATQAKNKQNNLIKQHAFKVSVPNNDITEKYFMDGIDILQDCWDLTLDKIKDNSVKCIIDYIQW